MARNNRQQDADQNPAGKVLDILGSIAESEGAREQTSDRVKVRLEREGSFIVGYLADLREFEAKKPNEKPQNVAYLDLPNGEQVRMNMPTDLCNKLSRKLVGEWVVIAHAGQLNTGHRTGTPMTLFRVWAYGQELPAKVAEAAESASFSYGE